MSISYDRALIAKQCADIIKTAERVDTNLSWFYFVGHFMIRQYMNSVGEWFEIYVEVAK